jgi:putative thioredoxin
MAGRVEFATPKRTVGRVMAESRTVVEVTAQNFQTEVVERSKSVPVVVLFWADQLPPAKDARRVLETLATQYQGKFVLALSDVSRDQALAQHLRVQGLPSIRVVQGGQLIDQMEGPQGERVLREMLDRLTMSSGDLLREDLETVLAAGDFGQAIAILKEALAAEPNNPAFKLEYADVLILHGDLEEARKIIATIPEGAEGRDRPVTRLQMMEEAAGMAELADLEAGLAKNPDDLELCYQASVRHAMRGNYEASLDYAMNILRKDRKFRDDIGRATMVRIFALLPKGSELAKTYRRRMFTFMH